MTEASTTLPARDRSPAAARRIVQSALTDAGIDAMVDDALLLVTELVTNACKYAYPDRPGEVRVALTRAGDDAFTLAVEDDGCGIMQDAGPRGTGLGTKLIRAMAQSLQSAVEYDPAHRGCRATLTAPIG